MKKKIFSIFVSILILSVLYKNLNSDKIINIFFNIDISIIAISFFHLAIYRFDLDKAASIFQLSDSS